MPQGCDKEKHGHNNEHNDKHEHAQQTEQFEKYGRVFHVDALERLTMTTPVEIKAHAEVCNVEIKDGGHEIIRERHSKCNHLRFKIRQHVEVHVPVQYIVEVEVKKECAVFDDMNNHVE